MNNGERLRVAVIGLGAVTRNIHFPAYAQLSDRVALIAGCDTDKRARELSKNKFEGGAVFESPEEMLKEVSPDIVSVCTPPSLHTEQARLALDHGCDVFCEKPLAENLSDANELVRAAKAAGRHVVINNQFPYMNIHRAAKEMIGKPEFGRLLFLQAWQSFRPTADTEAGWRGDLRRRTCFEFGIHVFSLVRYFFEDEPATVYAHMPNPLSKFNSDVLNLVTLEFKDGRAATIVLNRLTKSPERYLELRLDGENASIQTSIGGELRLEAGLHTRERRPFLGFSFVKGGKAVLQDGNSSRVIATDPINPFASSTAFHFGNFLTALKNGGSPPGNVEDNRKTLALVFAAYDSAEQGRPVNFGDYLL